MPNERFTEAQIREAYDKANMPRATFPIDTLMAELNRPAIGPGVPVMYDDRESAGDYLAYYCNLPKGSTNIRVLIPVPDAREIARWAITRYAKVENVDGAMAELDRDLAVYTRGESS